MQTSKLSVKGQVVLPAALRAAKAWQAGMQFEVVSTAESVLPKPLLPAGPFAPTRLDEVFGMAGDHGPMRSLAEMDAAVRAEAARQR
jgi:bifunctional DNA-binding transcriptional regulator/antitoxin component of YhaV-PrlF toxin-antitoxin module